MTVRVLRLWRRSHWEDLADRLLLAVRPYAGDGRALITLPGPTSASGLWSDGLEGFARTFLLAAFRVAGADGKDPHGLLAEYAEGLRRGTDPGSAERWPTMIERRQARVEAASIVIALSETRPWLWDQLDEGTRARVVDWLADIVGTTDYGNNWLWFQNVVESFLASVGGPWSQDDLDRNAELQERLYVGDGWYSDGAGRDGRLQSFDYYAGWAWHVYPLLDARIRGTGLAQTHRARMSAFLEQAALLVAPDGAPVLQGRSLTYRFAMLAPFWAGALADATPLSPGQTRAITSAVMQHFVDHSAIDDGLLRIGWHREFPRIRQLYTGAGSPYWASKAFLGLLLPPDHPAWTAEPESPLSWERDSITLLEAPGWLVQTTHDDGVVRVINHGSDRLPDPAAAPVPDDPFYRRQSYATHSAPQLLPETIAAPVESHTALLDAAGLPSHRGGIERVHLAATVAVSRCRPYWLDHGGTGAAGDSASWASVRHGPTFTTASVVHGSVELRLAWIDADGDVRNDGTAAHRPANEESPWPSDPGPWRVRVGGWALAGEPDDLVVETSDAEGEDGLAVGTPEPDRHGDAGERGESRVRRRSDGLVSAVQGVRGLDDVGAVRLEGADPLGPSSVVPWARSTASVGPGEIVAALVTLTGLASSGALSRQRLPRIVVRPDGTECVVVHWPDGARDVVPVAPA
ncbi:DUF2264 domain-containing protein [Phytoactinopolyspora endophytica]|uniref:DUF2264 domain-containing protein n=1 Tax=Phytoactinopolyspora endophytica TaxID=1642495 RepID=UPI00101E12EC|nr:DUF2264 domain-containing protein [Phytoactinopolyspora endophytica]